MIGPTGNALGEEGTLYVADTLGNRIAAVPGALFRQTALGGGGVTVAKSGFLNGPLGLNQQGVYFVNDSNNTLDLLH